MRTPMRLLFAFPLLASAGNYSGTVRFADNSPAHGVTVSLAGTALSSTTDPQGRWSLSTASSTAPRATFAGSQASSIADGFRLRWSFNGRDAAGRPTPAVPNPRPAPVASARAHGTAPDTLVYIWNKNVFLRDTASGNSTGTDRILDTTWNSSIVYGYLLDGRDTQTYRTVKIGFTTWLAQNLNYAGTKGDTGLCYQRDPANCAKWGRLYLWDDAMAGSSSNGARGICPIGWHVPTRVEWNDLQGVARSGGRKSGTQLRATTGWTAGGGATDALGFRALPGGDWYKLNGAFGSAGDFATWHTSTAPEFFITQISLGWEEDSLWQLQKSFGDGSSLRCTMN